MAAEPPSRLKKPRRVCRPQAAKIWDHFLSRHAREKKYLSGCQCGILPPAAKLCAQQTASLLSENSEGIFDSEVRKFKLHEIFFIRNLRLIDKPPLFCYHKTTQREERYGFWRTTAALAPPVRSDPGAVCRGASGLAPGGEQVGKRSFP